MTQGDVELRDVPIFSELSKRDLKTVAKLMTEVFVDEGRVLTRQGTPGREFMVIMDGTASVEIDGTTVAHLKRGDFLGELSIVSGAPRAATVVATSNCVLQVLNRREFMSLLDESPAIGRKVLIGAVKRLQVNNSKTTH